MKSKLASLVILAVILGLVAPADALAQFSTLPGGFTDQLVVDDVPSPTAIAWLPNGDMLITSQTGRLFQRSANGQSVTELSLPVGAICTNGERGLLGIAVDPSFSQGRPFLYLFYSHRLGENCNGTVVNRVSRLPYDNGNLGAERVLIDNISSPASNHNGGDLQFGRNGLLHISVGDGGEDLRSGRGGGANANARRLDVLVGKILRIDIEGGIPDDNPFQGPGTTRCAATGGIESQSQGVRAEKKNNRKARKRKRKKRNNQPPAATICQEIFATGLRNPFRIAFDPDDATGPQRLYINDVGQNDWEEIDSGTAGADYGWNEREGPCRTGERGESCPADGRFVEPVYAYEHQNGCNSITGGAFVPAAAGWTGRAGHYIFSDFACGRLFTYTSQEPGDPLVEFASGFPQFQGAIHLAFGPDGALYYTTYSGGGQVRKIDN